MSTAALRQAFFALPDSEQAALLDDLIVGFCEAAWEARISGEMEDRVEAVLRGEMSLHSTDSVFEEMRQRQRA
jgi:hypothetical protein